MAGYRLDTRPFAALPRVNGPNLDSQNDRLWNVRGRGDERRANGAPNLPAADNRASVSESVRVGGAHFTLVVHSGSAISSISRRV
jgi:hypothetical protein